MERADELGIGGGVALAGGGELEQLLVHGRRVEHVERGAPVDLRVRERVGDDRVLLVDDFLSSGAAQEALMRLCGMAGSTPIGVTALLEKVFDSGRIKLSGFDVPVETLVRILDVENGQINIE